MLGKTHMAVGIATTLALTSQATLPELILAGGAGAVGAVISDIDVGTSESHKEANKIIAMVTITMIGIGLLDYHFQLGIWNKIKNNTTVYQLVIASLIFIAICMYGKEKPHRSFMHSFLALGLLSGVIAGIYLPAVKYFSIGFLSHLVLDMFNYKKVRLLYPMKKGVCFRLFHAQGMANEIAFITGVIVAVVEVAMAIWKNPQWIFFLQSRL
jgi:inner membrane protein